MCFKNMIDGDIEDYKRRYPSLSGKKDNYIFNFWVMENMLFRGTIPFDSIVDFVTVNELITDGSKDKGIDCYFINRKDENSVHLIQNKYYNEGTTLKKDNLHEKFFEGLQKSLESGTFAETWPRIKMGQEIQSLYNNGNEVKFHIYISMKCKGNSYVCRMAKKWNENPHNWLEIVVHDIKAIAEEYCTGKIYSDTAELTLKLKITEEWNSDEWEPSLFVKHPEERAKVLGDKNLTLEKIRNIDGKAPFLSIVDFVKLARGNGYNLLSLNPREYYGSDKKGSLNERIISEINNPQTKNKFSNCHLGLSIVCDKIIDINIDNGIAYIRMKNPQIVNGGQSTYNGEAAYIIGRSKFHYTDEYYKDMFYKVEIKEIKESPYKSALVQDLVTAKNEQHQMKTRDVYAHNDFNANLQKFIYENSGIFLAVKPTDKNDFIKRYLCNPGKVNEIYNKAKPYLIKACYTEKQIEAKRTETLSKKSNGLIIDVNILYSVVLAMIKGKDLAYHKKDNVLIPSEEENILVVEYIKNEMQNSKESFLILCALILRVEDSNPFFTEDDMDHVYKNKTVQNLHRSLINRYLFFSTLGRIIIIHTPNGFEINHISEHFDTVKKMAHFFDKNKSLCRYYVAMLNVLQDKINLVDTYPGPDSDNIDSDNAVSLPDSLKYDEEVNDLAFNVKTNIPSTIFDYAVHQVEKAKTINGAKHLKGSCNKAYFDYAHKRVFEYNI